MNTLSEGCEGIGRKIPTLLPNSKAVASPSRRHQEADFCATRRAGFPRGAFGDTDRLFYSDFESG
jgi:hypothetical protein